jgi:hypothetical protein
MQQMLSRINLQEAKTSYERKHLHLVRRDLVLKHPR